MTASAQLPLRCWAEIDLAALERNLKLIRASLPPNIKYVAVVKADAYGHGLPHTAARLMHAGADLFAVANIAEAMTIRELSADWPVLLLSPVLPEEDRYLADFSLAATVSSADEVRRFDAIGRAAGKPVQVHLKIDTGMGRLGVWHTEAAALFEQIRAASGVKLAGVFTHFASADEDPAFTAEQRQLFLAVLGAQSDLNLNELFIHADNSAGLETTPGGGSVLSASFSPASLPKDFAQEPSGSAHLPSDERRPNLAGAVPQQAAGSVSAFNAVRVGLLQFGVLPHPNSMLARVRTEPVFSFHTRVGLVKNLPAGTGVSYGRTHLLKRPTRIALLTAGYGDGIARALSNRGSVLIRGRRCPILGRVCMDQTIIDITDVPEEVKCGDPVALVGRQGGAEITVTEFARWDDTIPWETLCSVTKRVPRLYRTALGV